MDPVVTPAVAAWLLKDVVAPDAYQRSLDTLRSRPWHRDVLGGVRRNAGQPTRWYKKWLRRPETFELLTRRTEEAYSELVRTLANDENRRWIGRPPSEEHIEEQVVETIRHFLPALDPSLAVAVAEDRNEDRHREVLRRIDAKTSFEVVAGQLPPPVASSLASVRSADPSAERVAQALVAGEPRSVLTSWSRSLPDWLDAAGGQVIAAVGLACQAYGLRSDASRFSEEAATRGNEVQRCLAVAAFEAAAAEESERALSLLERAQDLGESKFVSRVAAAIAEDAAGVVAAGTPDLDDSLDVNLAAQAMLVNRDVDGAIAMLRSALALDPNRTASALLLARALLDRSRSPSTTSRTADRREALELALTARDARRAWRGNSVEAVEIACQAALLLGEFERVVALGTEPPRGEALLAETSGPDVMFSVAQAAMAMGDDDTARSVAQASDGFKQSLLEADLASQRGEASAVLQGLYDAAWQLAHDELDKLAVWMGAAHAGVDQIPGEDELAENAELHACCRAARHLARGDLGEAATLLRPLHTNESARRLLVGVYVAQGEIDAAVNELQDMARRFSTSEPLVRAVELLVDDGRTLDAADVSDEALRLTHPGSRPRRFLHEVGVAAAHDRQAWSEMEERLRAWIEECGATRRATYLIAQARLNKGSDRSSAWRAIEEFQGDVTPQSPLEAHLWIVLASQFRPGASTLSQALALIEAFPEAPEVRAAGVNAFFLSSHDDELDPEEVQRWQEHVRARAEADDPDDTFISISMPDDPAEMIEALRPYLQPQAERIEEWRAKVRDEGFPVGMLAVAAGRPYTAVLVHRAAGFVPFASSDDEIMSIERAAAVAAVKNGNVVVDNSALATGWLIPTLWQTLIASFASARTNDESRRDALAAADVRHDRQQGTLGWDIASQRPSLHEDDEEVLRRVREHADWIKQQTARLPSQPAPASTADSHHELGAWMVTFETARASGLALWADDLGLRTLARNEGLSAFGTDSLLAALHEAGRISANDQTAALAKLRDEFYVDLEVDDAWLLQSGVEGGATFGPALATIARRQFWANPDNALNLWTRFIGGIGRREPDEVAHAVYAACVGVARLLPPTQVSILQAGLLGKSFGAIAGRPSAFARCCEAAAEGCRVTGLPDPVPLALSQTLELLTGAQGAGDAAQWLATIGDDLDGVHWNALRQVLFGA